MKLTIHEDARGKAVDLDIIKEIYQLQVYDTYNGNIGLDLAAVSSVVDIGANIGVWVSYIKQKAPNCHVIAIEPNEINYTILEDNCSRMDNVQALKKIVIGDDETGPIYEYINRDSPGGHYYGPANKHDSSKTALSTVTLKQLLSITPLEQIDLLKIDCEGAEYDILLGGCHSLVGIHFIVGEFHKVFGKDLETLKDDLDVFGFDVMGHIRQDDPNTGYFSAVNRYWPPR